MKIGTLDIPNAVVLAPMENVTDIPFRLICKRLGADIVYTEFVNAEGLVRNVKKTRRKMLFLEEERPFGIQIYGGNECSMEGAAKMAEEQQPDIIDINCGCWVKNIAGHGAGAGLLRDPEKMRTIVSSVVRSVSIPVTVKTRIGWDEKSIRIIEIAKMIEDTGAQALTIHCRTRSQGHSGDPDFSWIPSVKNAIKIPVIVNGGIDSAQKAKSIFDLTGCDALMVARGAIHNPWLFSDIKQFLKTGQHIDPPSLRERILLMLDHLKLSIEYKGEPRAVLEFRKHYAGYLKGYPGIARLRAELMLYTTFAPIEGRFQEIMESSHFDFINHKADAIPIE